MLSGNPGIATLVPPPSYLSVPIPPRQVGSVLEMTGQDDVPEFRSPRLDVELGSLLRRSWGCFQLELFDRNGFVRSCTPIPARHRRDRLGPFSIKSSSKPCPTKSSYGARSLLTMARNI